MLKRIIPSSGETLPAIGLGTWQTFDVAKSADHPNLKNILEAIYTSGARLIDSSPMYGRAEEVVGEISSALPFANDLFYATKVWVSGLQEGIRQMESSMRKMNRSSMDLIQVHNLLDWQTHLPVLKRWKSEGKIRYTGITHYTDSSHAELEKIMRAEKPDFVQFNYSIEGRNAEKRLLPAAADLGIATLINRPLGEGRLFAGVREKPLPSWAAALDIHSWSAFFLKFILSHPAVTCVIPATGKPPHADENLAAGMGHLPDQLEREEMAAYFRRL